MLGAAILIAALSSPGPFVLVNGSSGRLSEIAIRQSVGSAPWRPLGPSSLSPGARSAIPAQSGDLCAFDIRAKVGTETATWLSVNLCDVKSVTLNRRADGTLWVDYD
jgi:hypothetical protein